MSTVQQVLGHGGMQEQPLGSPQVAAYPAGPAHGRTIFAVIISKNSWKSMLPDPSLSMSLIIFLISSFLGSKPRARIATFSSLASMVPAHRAAPSRGYPPGQNQIRTTVARQTQPRDRAQACSRSHGMHTVVAQHMAHQRTGAISIEQVKSLTDLLLLLLCQFKLLRLLVCAAAAVPVVGLVHACIVATRNNCGEWKRTGRSRGARESTQPHTPNACWQRAFKSPPHGISKLRPIQAQYRPKLDVPW